MYIYIYIYIYIFKFLSFYQKRLKFVHHETVYTDWCMQTGKGIVLYLPYWNLFKEHKIVL